MSKHDWIRFWLHFPVGLFVAGLTWFIPLLGMLLGVSFLVYEIVQDWRKSDSSFKDIYGYTFGLGTGGVIILIVGGLIW